MQGYLWSLVTRASRALNRIAHAALALYPEVAHVTRLTAITRRGRRGKVTKKIVHSCRHRPACSKILWRSGNVVRACWERDRGSSPNPKSRNEYLFVHTGTCTEIHGSGCHSAKQVYVTYPGLHVYTDHCLQVCKSDITTINYGPG